MTFTVPIARIDIAQACRTHGWIFYDYRDESQWPREKKYAPKVYGWPSNKKRGQSRGFRPWSQCTAVMLHSTGVSGMHGRRGLGIPCHAFVGADESITLCHHADRLVWHGHAANKFSYGIEVSGKSNFDAPSQIERTRILVRSWQLDRLAAVGPDAPCYIMAHRQSLTSRPVDPGAVIWREIAEWAIEQHGFLLGPTVGTGRDIPPQWRTSQG